MTHFVLNNDKFQPSKMELPKKVFSQKCLKPGSFLVLMYSILVDRTLSDS